MSWTNRLKIFFCIHVFFPVCNSIVNNGNISEPMNVDEWKSSVATAYATIRDCEVVEFVRPSRSKRSGKKVVNIEFNDSGTPSIATLYVVEDDDLISRTRTGIWTAFSSSRAYQNVIYTPSPQIFDTIGRIEFLQNVEEGSAVTRFFDSYGNENLVGILKHKYTVKTLSKEQLFLSICESDLTHQEYIYHRTFTKNYTLLDLNLKSANSTDVPEVVHPKLLVIPDFSVVQRYKSQRDFMMQLIAQLNCIDMMFRQLNDPEVHLNIVGIIMPSDDETTPYISEHIDDDNRIHGDIVVNEAEIYFQNEKNRFPRGKWDSILMLTTYPMSAYNADMGGLVRVNGLSKPASGCLGSAGIARITEKMESIYSLAHEIGKMFSERRGEDNVKLGQCEDLDGHQMVTGYDYSAKFEWSNCSRADFQTYFRSDAGNCTHFQAPKVPDAIKSMLGTWLTIEGQCDNQHQSYEAICTQEVVPGCFVHGCEVNGMCHSITKSPLGKLLSLCAFGRKAGMKETTMVI